MTKEVISFRNAETGVLLLTLPVELTGTEIQTDFIIGALLAIMYADKAGSLLIGIEHLQIEDDAVKYHGCEEIKNSFNRFMDIHRQMMVNKQMQEIFKDLGKTKH